MLAPELRPERRRDVELGIADLPEQEVADAHLARGADAQVHVAHRGVVETRGERLLVDLRGIEPPRGDILRDAARGVGELRPSAVAEREAQRHAAVPGRELLCLTQRGERLLGKFVHAADRGEADRVLVDLAALVDRELPQQAHEVAHLLARPLPVLDRERVERQLLDAEPRALARRLADGVDPRRVAAYALPAGAPCPAPVAVHDDPDRARDLRRGHVGQDLLGVRRGRGPRLHAAPGTITCSRLGPTETSVTGAPTSCAIASTKRRAFAGSAAIVRTPLMSSAKPSNSR